jgi:hypothetical protein
VCVCARAFSNSAPADSLDEDKSGLVSMEEFCKLFEPTIVRRASSSASATMDVEDLMKETFSGILLEAKLERSVVIQVLVDSTPLCLEFGPFVRGADCIPAASCRTGVVCKPQRRRGENQKKEPVATVSTAACAVLEAAHNLKCGDTECSECAIVEML